MKDIAMNFLFVLPPDPETRRRGVPLERDIFDARVAAARRVARKRIVLRFGLGAVRSMFRRWKRGLARPAPIGEKQAI